MPFGLSALAVKVLAGLALVAALLLGIGLWDAHQQALGAATVRADVATAAAAQVASAATETERRLAATQETVHVAQSQLAAASAAAGAAVRERDAARMQLNAYVRGRAVSQGASAAGGGSPAADSDLLLAGLLNESWDRSVELAAEADRRGIAGAACQRWAESLSH